jgi:hypothetical protein
MSLEAKEAVKSAFQNLKTEVGAALIALIFFIQVSGTLTGSLSAGGGLAGTFGALLSLVLFFATAVVALGSLRSLDEGKLEKEYFTENLTRPIIRLAGANIVILAFSVLAFTPLGALSAFVSGSALSGATSAALIIEITGIAISLTVFFYIILALCLSLPEIAVKNSRMFQALDSSVQRTRGHKKQMMLALTPLVALQMVSLLINTASGSPVSSPISVIVSGVIGAVVTAGIYSLLIEFHQRIGEGEEDDGFF